MRLICIYGTVNSLTHDLHHCQAGGFRCALTDVTMSWLNILVCFQLKYNKEHKKHYFKMTMNSLMHGTPKVISALEKVSVFIIVVA